MEMIFGYSWLLMRICVFHIPSINIRFAHFSSRQNTIHVAYQTINQINTIASIEPFALAPYSNIVSSYRRISHTVLLLILCDMTRSKYMSSCVHYVISAARSGLVGIRQRWNEIDLFSTISNDNPANFFFNKMECQIGWRIKWKLNFIKTTLNRKIRLLGEPFTFLLSRTHIFMAFSNIDRNYFHFNINQK